MKEGQKNIYFIAGANKEEVSQSPFAERLVKKVGSLSGFCLDPRVEVQGLCWCMGAGLGLKMVSASHPLRIAWLRRWVGFRGQATGSKVGVWCIRKCLE
jgi:hypothetical protein